MTVTLDLAQDTERTLLSRAEARGTSVANYIETIIARDVMQADARQNCRIASEEPGGIGRAPSRPLYR